jgi:cytochrome c553
MKYLLSLLIVSAASVAPLSVARAQDAAEGGKKVAMCIGCHGIPGYQASFPEVHKVPMIAGQGAKYIVSALTAYKKGDRKHPTMRAIAASLTDKDMADVAAFYEQQGKDSATPMAAAAPVPPAEVAELLKKGNCASCHGDNLSKPIDPGYPKLAGQHADYLYVALTAYATTGNPQVGRGNAIMGGQVKQFKLEELKLLANYIGSLPGETHTVPQSKFR